MSGHQDSNLGPPGPKPGALTGLRYAPNNFLKWRREYEIKFLNSSDLTIFFVIRQGLEPRTYALEGRCSIQLSYRTYAERGGFEPPVQFNPYDSLANCWFQPLTHLSVRFDLAKRPQKGAF
jgi:hypothetical protein